MNREFTDQIIIHMGSDTCQNLHLIKIEYIIKRGLLDVLIYPFFDKVYEH